MIKPKTQKAVAPAKRALQRFLVECGTKTENVGAIHELPLHFLFFLYGGHLKTAIQLFGF